MANTRRAKHSSDCPRYAMLAEDNAYDSIAPIACTCGARPDLPEKKCARNAAPWLRPTLCEGMRLALRDVPENFDGRGVTLTRGWIEGDGPTPAMPHRPHAPRYLGVTYKPKRGETLVLNVCPWCGASLRFDEVDRVAALDGLEE